MRLLTQALRVHAAVLVGTVSRPCGPVWGLRASEGRSAPHASSAACVSGGVWPGGSLLSLVSEQAGLAHVAGPWLAREEDCVASEEASHPSSAFSSGQAPRGSAQADHFAEGSELTCSRGHLATGFVHQGCC